MTAALDCHSLSVHFGGVQALSDVSLSLASGEVVGIVGPNGSGKSTLLNAICGVVRCQGTVAVGGRSLKTGRPEAAAAAGIARVFQAPQPFASLTVGENVRMAVHASTGAGIRHALLTGSRLGRVERFRGEKAAELLNELGLWKVRDMFPASLSYGQRRMLDVARSLAAEPAVLLLDEPSAGLNDSETEFLVEVVANLASSRMAVVVVEHKIPLLNSLCSRLVVLHQGEYVVEGAPDAVWASTQVQAAYLGAVS